MIPEKPGLTLRISYPSGMQDLRGASVRWLQVAKGTALSEHVRITLPIGVANDLLDAKLAVVPIATRGPTLAETFTVTVDCINTGSALVSIAVAMATCRRLATAMIKRHHPSDPNTITIKITRGNATQRKLIKLRAGAGAG